MKRDLNNYGLRINSCNTFESYKDGAWNPRPVSRDYDLMVFTSGAGTLLINGKQCTVSSNDTLLIRRGDAIKDPVSAGRINNMFVHFDFLGEDGEPTDPTEAILPPRLPSQENHMITGQLTQAILRKCARGDKESAVAILRAILILLADQSESWSKDFSVLHRARLLDEFAAQILRDPAAKRSVPDMAAEVGMSAVQFTRSFRKRTGHSPGDFMVLARIERARMLLITTSRTVADIADSLGYSDVYYFTRQFTSKTGISPAAYRKSPKVRQNPKA